MARKMFEIGDVLPPKIKIYFDTTKHLTTPIDFQSMGLYGVYDSSATSTIILIPNPSSPLWGDLDTNFVYANWAKIYDITTKTWLMESIICDLSQYAPTERTMAHISGTANVLDFIAGMTWEETTEELPPPITNREKLQAIKDEKQALKQLLISNGVDTSNLKFGEYHIKFAELTNK